MTQSDSSALPLRDVIGFLPVRSSIAFAEGAFTPLPDFDDTQAWITEHANHDGFLYPPPVVTRRSKGGSTPPDEAEWEEVPNSERPAFLLRPLASHELQLLVPPVSANFREHDGAFLMNLASYLYGVRLQFHDWWLDGRLPIKGTHHVFVRPATAGVFISHAYRTWRGWNERARLLFSNALYMNARAPCYEWDWERFAISYMVFDALYRMAVECCGVPKVGHKERLYEMCQRFGLAVEAGNIEDIYRLRCELFHEALWDGSQPGDATGVSGYYQATNLRRLNQRLVPAILGHATDYVATSWSSRSMFAF